jgi:hypothetical protein
MGQVNYIVGKLRKRAHTGRGTLREMIDALETGCQPSLYQLKAAVRKAPNPVHRFLCFTTHDCECGHYLYLSLSLL